MRIAIVGGTGGFGRALAQRLQRIGENAVIGSRDPERARELALALGVEGGANADVVRDADLVVLDAIERRPRDGEAARRSDRHDAFSCASRAT